LELARSSGNKLSAAHAHYAAASIADSQGDGDAALRHSREALRLYESSGSRMLVAMAANALGWWTAQYGDPLVGRSLCESAILLQDDDPEGRAATFDSLGEIAYVLDEYSDAATYHEQALQLRQGLRNAYEEANTQSALGAVYLAMGHLERARGALTAALNLYTAQHRLDEADAIRARLQTTV
jgi:tetratricopeptide (TPR) repeat protein